MPTPHTADARLHQAFEEYYEQLLDASRVCLSDVLRREVWAVIQPLVTENAVADDIADLVDVELRRRGALLEG